MIQKVLAGLLIILIWAGAIAFQAWIVMLAAGVLNGYFAAVPAFSFWESAIISMVVALFLGTIRKKDK